MLRFMDRIGQFWTTISMLTCLVGSAGCSFIDMHAAAGNPSPLSAAAPSADSVSLEIFFAKAPLGDASINGPLWNEIDEQRLPAETRRRLAQYGIRAGVVGSHVPEALVKLLSLTDKPKPATDEPTPVKFEDEANVTKRLLQTRNGKRNEIVCSGTYDRLPLLQVENEQIGGKTYHLADGRFALKSHAQTSSRVELELVPEVHHGEQQPRWVGADGVLRLDPGKPREVFDDLRTRVPLAPGEMLVMTNLPEHPGSLGHYFFTQPTSERPCQKLLVIRVAGTADDESLSNEPTETASVNFGK
jgi:hypothetical protein